MTLPVCQRASDILSLLAQREPSEAPSVTSIRRGDRVPAACSRSSASHGADGIGASRDRQQVACGQPRGRSSRQWRRFLFVGRARRAVRPSRSPPRRGKRAVAVSLAGRTSLASGTRQAQRQRSSLVAVPVRRRGCGGGWNACSRRLRPIGAQGQGVVGEGLGPNRRLVRPASASVARESRLSRGWRCRAGLRGNGMQALVVSVLASSSLLVLSDCASSGFVGLARRSFVRLPSTRPPGQGD